MSKLREILEGKEKKGDLILTFRNTKAMERAMELMDDHFDGEPPSYALDDGAFGKVVRLFGGTTSGKKSKEAVKLFKKKGYKFDLKTVGEATTAALTADVAPTESMPRHIEKSLLWYKKQGHKIDTKGGYKNQVKIDGELMSLKDAYRMIEIGRTAGRIARGESVVRRILDGDAVIDTINDVAEQGKKLDNKKLNLRSADFPERGECEYCRYFIDPTGCKILKGPVTSEQVCDAIQGKDDGSQYKVKKEDIFNFVKGMIKDQPYQHKVIAGYDTPEGPIVIIEDSMKPKPHRFSLPMEFSVLHTSREHHWTQKEVDALIKSGKA